MKRYLFLILAVFGLNSYGQMYNDVKAHFRINGTKKYEILPDKPSTIEVWFTDTQTNEIIKNFKPMHGKIMHMVLVNKDLSIFKHIHPYLDPVTGRFFISVNVPVADPDNFHIPDAATTPGHYMLMADVDIKGKGMRMGHIMLDILGQSSNTEMVLDPISPDGSIISYHQSEDKKYKALLKQYKTQGQSGSLIEFEVDLYQENSKGDYIQVNDLEPWLAQGAHAVWVSDNFMGERPMPFAHMHSKLPGFGSTLVFSFHDNEIMKAGKQKMWVQIKHQDKVLTIPFIFDYF